MTHEDLLHMSKLFVKPEFDYSDLDLPVEVLTLAEGYLTLYAKLQEVQAERDALREKLEEAAAEIETLRVWQQEVSALMVAEKASHGEIVKACPACGAHEPKGQDRAWIVTGRPMLVCPLCRHQFTEPAFWQRASGPAKTTA